MDPDKVIIALGLSTPAERFCTAFDERRPRLRRQDLAAELGVHPTALCHSNFKLKPAHLAVAGERLGVSAEFLRDGAPDHAPPWMEAALAAVAEMRALLRCHCQGPSCGRKTCWLPDRLLVQLGIDAIWERIAPAARHLSRGQLVIIHDILLSRAKRDADQIVVRMSLGEWLQVIDHLQVARGTSGPRLAAHVCSHLRASGCLAAPNGAEA